MSRAAVAVVVLALLGAGLSAGTTSAEVRAAGCPKVKTPKPRSESRKPPKKPLDAHRTWTATLKTSCGSFTIRLDVKDSPHTTASFVSLARSHYFDNTIFHRIVPGFVIQGGDPTQSGEGGPGYTTVEKPPAGTRYVHGTVAMAKTPSQPAGAAGSQFFVVTARNAGLPAVYALLGHVVKGIRVVDRIGTLGDANQQPIEPVVIEKATLSSTR